MPLRRIIVAVLTTVGACAAASSALACTGGPYVYAGVAGSARVAGVGAALVASPQAFSVRSGHVAAWVGVGGPGEGPGGSDEWIQVGFSAMPSLSNNDLYFEVARPGGLPTYSRLRGDVSSGTSVRVAVLEMRSRRDWWRVWVDGSAASGPIHLPASHGRWRPVVTAESWDGGTAVCNDFSYRFDAIRVALKPGGVWVPLSGVTRLDSRDTIVSRSRNGDFVAAGGKPARAFRYLR
jgi:hypothetical protein